jgi:hypothetical protein
VPRWQPKGTGGLPEGRRGAAADARGKKPPRGGKPFRTQHVR